MDDGGVWMGKYLSGLGSPALVSGLDLAWLIGFRLQ